MVIAAFRAAIRIWRGRQTLCKVTASRPSTSLPISRAARTLNGRNIKNCSPSLKRATLWRCSPSTALAGIMSRFLPNGSTSPGISRRTSSFWICRSSTPAHGRTRWWKIYCRRGTASAFLCCGERAQQYPVSSGGGHSPGKRARLFFIYGCGLPAGGTESVSSRMPLRRRTSATVFSKPRPCGR